MIQPRESRPQGNSGGRSCVLGAMPLRSSTRGLRLSTLALVVALGSCSAGSKDGRVDQAIDVSTSITPAAQSIVRTAHTRLEIAEVGSSGMGVAAAVLEESVEGVVMELHPGLFRTDDRGQTWRNITPPPGPESWKYIFDIEVVGEQTIFAVVNNPAMGSAILKSVDGGDSWMTMAEGLSNLHHAGSTIELDFVDEQVGWYSVFVPPATGFASLLSTSDSGKSWAVVNEALPRSGEIYFLADGTGWLGGPVRLEALNQSQGLSQTSDGGLTWSDTAISLPPWASSAKVEFRLPEMFGDQGRVAVSLNDGVSDAVVVYTSADGGATWQFSPAIDPSANPETNATSWSADFLDETRWWVAGQTTSGVVTTITEGSNVSVLTAGTGPDSDLIDLLAFNTTDAWLRTTDGLWATRDGGLSWHPLWAEVGLGQGTSDEEVREIPACVDLRTALEGHSAPGPLFVCQLTRAGSGFFGGWVFPREGVLTAEDALREWASGPTEEEALSGFEGWDFRPFPAFMESIAISRDGGTLYMDIGGLEQVNNLSTSDGSGVFFTSLFGTVFSDPSIDSFVLSVGGGGASCPLQILESEFCFPLTREDFVDSDF